MKNLLNRLKKEKKGFLSLEYILILSIVVIFLIAIYVYTTPENVRNVADVTKSSLNKVLNANEDNGYYASNGGYSGNYSEGVGSTIYPDEDDWDEAEDFIYAVNASGVTITGYIGDGGSVVIPSKIEDLPVIRISASAFASKGLASVRVPNTVTEIGASAFYGNSLTNFVAPSSLVTIGDEAFRSNKLSSVSFNAKLKTIGANAFRDNNISYLDTKNITSIGENCFYSNTLAQIKIGSSLSTLGLGAFLDQGGLSGKAGTVDIAGEETRFNENWDAIFDDKFFGYKPE